MLSLKGKVKIGKFKKIKVLVLLCSALANFSYIKTTSSICYAKNINDVVVVDSKDESWWDIIDDFKDNELEYLAKGTEEIYPNLSEAACNDINQHEVKDVPSLKKFLNYMKSYEETKNFMKNYEFWKICDMGKGNYLLYTKHKKGLNLCAFLEKESFYKDYNYSGGNIYGNSGYHATSNSIKVPYVVKDTCLKALQTMHVIEHGLAHECIAKQAKDPNTYFYEGSCSAFTRYPGYANGYMNFYTYGARGASNFLKFQYNSFRNFLHLDKEMGDAVFNADKNTALSEIIRYGERNVDRLKYATSAYNVLAGKVDDSNYSDVNRYDNKEAEVIRKITLNDEIKAFKDNVHPSNCVVSVRISRGNMSEFANCLNITDIFCNQYDFKKSNFLKTREERDKHLYKYHYNKKYADKNGIYIKEYFDAAKYANLFVEQKEENEKNIKKYEKPTMLKDKCDIYVRYKDLGIENVTPAILDLFNFHEDAVETVLGRDEIEKISNFKMFKLFCGSEGIRVTTAGNDKVVSERDVYIKNVRNVLKAFVEKVQGLSDASFFKLNEYSDIDAKYFNDPNCSSDHYGYRCGMGEDINERIFSSYDGNILHIEDVLDIENGVLQNSKARVRENVIKNRKYIRNLANPFKYSEIYMAIRKLGTVAPYVEPLSREESLRFWYDISSCPEYVLPVKFNNCENNELGFVTRHIFLNLYAAFLIDSGYSYTGFTSIGKDGRSFLPINPVNEDIVCKEYLTDIKFLRNRFKDGTIEKYYKQFLKSGTINFINSYEKISVDDFIKITKLKFINLIKSTLKCLKEFYLENEKTYKNLFSYKDINNLPEKVLDYTYYKFPPLLEMGIRYVIPDSCKEYLDFGKKIEAYLKNLNKTKKDLDKAYADVSEGRASEARVKAYRKERYARATEVYKHAQKFLKGVCRRLFKLIKLYENLDVESVKNLLNNIEFLDFDSVNKAKDKSSKVKN